MARIALWLSLCGMLVCLMSPVVAQVDGIPWPTEGWQTSTPEAQGMDSETLAAMLDTLVERNINIRSVVIVRNGYLVLEAYRYPYTWTDLQTVYSVTKSVASMLVGIAIDKGYMEGLDHSLVNLFPDYILANRDAKKDAVTLRHLLTMSAGFNWPGGMDEPLLGDMMDSDHWVQFMLDRPMLYEPGQQFTYNSGVSNLLMAAVREATEAPAIEFAQAYLFAPLGIETFKWADDRRGYHLGGFGLQLMPRDMAKLGYLYLNKGQWDGQQIVSEAWVEASTKKQINASPIAPGYGYQWWVSNKGYYMANGYGGQYIIVDPASNLVAVFTSSLPIGQFHQPEVMLETFIRPAIESDTALTENADALEMLEESVGAFSTAIHNPEPEIPALAAQISGKTYRFEENEFGWETFSLTFGLENTATFQIDDDPPLIMGLDSVERVNDMSMAQSIFAIGFDNILRVDPVAGEERMLVTGDWVRDNRFRIRIGLAGTVNSYQITLTFDEQTVQVTTQNELSKRNVSFKAME